MKLERERKWMNLHECLDYSRELYNTLLNIDGQGFEANKKDIVARVRKLHADLATVYSKLEYEYLEMKRKIGYEDKN